MYDANSHKELRLPSLIDHTCTNLQHYQVILSPRHIMFKEEAILNTRYTLSFNNEKQCIMK